MSSVSLGAAPTADCPDRADRGAALVTVCFSVQAAAEPGVMPRVLELFAKRGLVPQKWQSAVSGTVLTIDVQIGGVRRVLSDYNARFIGQVAQVDAVVARRRRRTRFSANP